MIRNAALAAVHGGLIVAAASGCATAVVQPLHCDPVLTFADGKSPSRARHVATSGSDSGGDGSTARPFRTIGRAASEIAPGTAIIIHSGSYAGGTMIAGLHGTASEPIYIIGAPDEPPPVIDGGREGLHFSKPRYLVLQHLVVANTADNGINVDDGEDVGNEEAATHVIFRDLDIHDTGRQPSGIADCLKLSGVNYVFVLDSRFARCGNGAGSGAVGVNGVGVHHAQVRSNTFRDTGFGGIQFKGASRDIDIQDNRFEEAGWRGVNMGGSTGRPFFRPPLSTAAPNVEAAWMRVLGNLFVGGETAAAFAGCVGCEFSHNIVIDPSKWALRILQETVAIDSFAFAPAANGVIAANVFYFRRADWNTGEDVNVGGGTDTRSFSMIANRWYAHDEPSQSRPRLSTFKGADAQSVDGVEPEFMKASPGLDPLQWIHRENCSAAAVVQ